MSRVAPFYALLPFLVISSHSFDPAVLQQAVAAPPAQAQQVPTQQAVGVATQADPQITVVQPLPSVSPVSLASVPVQTASATLSAATPGQQVVAVPAAQLAASTVLGPSALQPTVQLATQPAVPTATQPAVPTATQPAVQMATVGAPTVNAASLGSAAGVTTPTPSSAANAAASMANQAAQAAKAAALAASTAANAATNANTAAIAAASTAAAARASATSPAGSNQAAAPLPFSQVVHPATMPSADSLSTSQWLIARVTTFIAGLTFASVIKGVCITGNVLVQISPFPQAKRWEARGCTADSDAAPYVSIAFAGCQWCFYGLFAWLVTSRSGFLVLVQSNILGAILGSYYVSTFFKNCRREEPIAALQKYLSAIMALVFLQVCGLCVLPLERALFLTGLVSSFCSFIAASSVLVTVPIVLRTKDARSLPGPFALANMCSAATWVVCGYIIEDPMVMMPNMFATCCSGLVVGLKMTYPSSDDDDACKGKLEQAEEGIKKFEMPEKKEASVAFSKLGKLPLSNPTEFTPIKPGVEKIDKAILPENWAGTLLAVVTTGSDGTGGTC